MRRRQRELYVPKRYPRNVRKIAPAGFDSTSPVTTLPQRPGLVAKFRASSEVVLTKSANASEVSARKGKAARVRRRVQRLVALNAVLSWIATGVGYVIVSRLNNPGVGEDILRESAKTFICLISLLQVFLVVMYRSDSLSYEEAVRSALLLSSIPIKKLRKSPHHILQSGFEGLIHMVPMVPTFGKSSSPCTVLGVSLDTLSFTLLLLRNYHTVQLFYWWSRFSDLRTHHYATIANKVVTWKFVLRCCFAWSGAWIVFFLYTVLVVIAGFLQYAIEREALSPDVSLWNKVWEVTVTQASVGYGDSAPATLLSKLTMTFSCFCGICVLGFANIISQSSLSLNTQEYAMSSALLYQKSMRKYRLVAIQIIQKWWRLMHMRLSRVTQSHIIIDFYSYLLVFRHTMASSRHIKARQFEGQIAAFDTVIHKHFHSVTEYIFPIREAHMCLPDLLRNEYKILVAVRKLRQIARNEVPYTRSSSVNGAKTGETTRRRKMQGNQGFAKACNTAMQNCKNRLARAENVPISPWTPQNEVKRRFTEKINT